MNKSNSTIVGKSIESAYSFIEKQISAGIWNSLPHLPSLESLARMAGVSRNTMWKALRIAKKSNLLSSERGGFITLGSNIKKKPMPEGSPVSTRDRHQVFIDKKEIFERDILDGVYAQQDALPGSKQLQSTYGVSAATLRKMARSLVADRLLTPYKRSFRVASPAPHRRIKSRVILISEGIRTAKTVVHNQRLQDLINTMEYLGALHGISTDFVDLDILEPDVSMRMQAAIGERESIRGIIFNVPATPSQTVRDRIREFTGMLAQFNCPVAVFDSTGEFHLPPGTGKRPLQLFRMAAVSAGRDMGRYLVNLGHRSAAYITLLHRHDWSTQRFAGLAKVFRMMGPGSKVTPFTIDTIEGHFDRAFWLGDMGKDVIEKVFARTTPFELTGYLAEIDRSRKNVMLVDDTRIKQLKTNVAVLGELAGRNLDPDIFAALRDAVIDEAAFKGNDYILEPLFEKACAEKNITAWIHGNSGEAHAALRFLKSKNIRVPQDISVVGFDNTATSFENRLTTYDFNMSKAMHRMFRFVTHDSPRAASAGLLPEELEGMIIERETAGKAQIKVKV
jgi:DNA-binding LacI/PurR family transcriptional regulator/DNA-binding GntR family transcriptional regulator